jgi:hypothetical protein
MTITDIKGYTYRKGDKFPTSRSGQIAWRPNRDEVIRTAKAAKATHLISITVDNTIGEEIKLSTLNA